ncbi:MAG: c-type cytochrome [Gammaproteobacteria bacterium]|nr:c-type cytochrome [Gammaproteobacteria bacterium]
MKKLVLAATVVMAATGTTVVMADKGQEIYQQACFACHGTGAAGAPKLDDKANWAPRLAQGMATLEKHAITGFQGKSGMMPPKGGRTDLADADIKAAVAYMANQAK